MSSLADLLLGPDETPTATPVQAAPAAPSPRGGGGSVLDLILGEDGAYAAAPAQPAGKVVDDPSRALGFIDQAKGSFAINEKQWLANAARSLYPNDPQAVRRFGKTRDGQFFHVGDDGKPYAVTPQSGMARIANLGQGVGPAVPAVAGTVAGIMGLPFGGFGAVATAAGGAGAGEVIRQNVGNAILPEPEQIDPWQVTKETVLSGAGQGLGNAMTGLAGRLAVQDIAHYQPQMANSLSRKASEMGVRLTPAESTGLNSLIGEQKRLMATPSSANVMGEFLAERNREVMDAWRGFTRSIATPIDSTALGRRANEAAEAILERAQGARTAIASPFYQQAESKIGSVNPGAVIQYIEQALPHAKGSDRKALQFAQSQLRLTGEETVDMSFRGLNGAKMAIDAMLENPDIAAKQGIDRHAHRTLNEIRNRIVQAIDNAGGGAAGPYAAGRQAYAQATEQTVTPIQEVLAPLLKITPTNSSINRAAQKLLDPAERSPEVVARARAMIEPQYPQLWSNIKQKFLEDRAFLALQENAKGTVSNVGGNIAKQIGDDATEANLRAAMTPREFRAYQDIVDVFRATGRALDANSDTAFKQQAIQQAKAAAGGWVSRIVRNMNPAKLVENAGEFLANRNYERQAEAVARIYAQGDAESLRALRSLRQLSETDSRRLVVLGAVLTRAGVFGAEEALDFR